MWSQVEGAALNGLLQPHPGLLSRKIRGAPRDVADSATLANRGSPVARDSFCGAGWAFCSYVACPPGYDPPCIGCYPLDGSQCCSDGNYCPPGEYCLLGGGCCQDGTVCYGPAPDPSTSDFTITRTSTSTSTIEFPTTHSSKHDITVTTQATHTTDTGRDDPETTTSFDYSPGTDWDTDTGSWPTESGLPTNTTSASVRSTSGRGVATSFGSSATAPGPLSGASNGATAIGVGTNGAAGRMAVLCAAVYLFTGYYVGWV
ncbi:hypothetical protein L227DRAFT_617718 [Lentinus tigrinus ALCF2SS1-6]|uniref:Uncharacterized protein n=1 Tax=Lentinus tigrinus ALCF2SS1-6 TaxID=1328759 RepID=A0A5C2RLR0_9APHY|nr:hypothetical protein L227DRAFT_617718 [Lentinus tigrinus ALCF2SS1-6]